MPKSLYGQTHHGEPGDSFEPLPKVNRMSLREFFSVHRQELLRACRSDQNARASIEEFAKELCELSEQPVWGSAPHRAIAHELVGESPAIRRVRLSIEQVTRRSRMPVLLLGEVGTGKRRSARFLHAATYPDGELFELQEVQQLPVLERMLAAMRSRSSALAIGGLSVFVNELSEAPERVQAAFAKLMGEHTLPLRLVASSRRPLAHACREGLLRADVLIGPMTTIELPNLRDRLADLRPLLAYFESEGANPAQPALAFSDEAFSLLAAYPWPGNLIELAGVVKRLQALEAPGTIQAHHLADLGQVSSGIASLPPGSVDPANVERESLLQALMRTDNNRSRAPRLLGSTRDRCG